MRVWVGVHAHVHVGGMCMRVDGCACELGGAWGGGGGGVNKFRCGWGRRKRVRRATASFRV